MSLRIASLALLLLGGASPAPAAEPKIKVLIIDGQNNHNWKATTPLLQKILADANLFDVEVATTEPKSTVGFAPKFKDFSVVVSNYSGTDWPKETMQAFDEFVKGGGGFVSYHAADNSFPKWPEYNAMIGVGGWGGRRADEGAYLRIRDGNFVADATKGDRVGNHGKQHAFLMTTRVKDHPITKGLPEKWMHAQDELYDRLRGPAKDVTVLASAFSDKATGGTGLDEPLLMTIDYGKGRVFHTALGHAQEALHCVGFACTFSRGVEWAANGKVTQPVPKDFPTAEKVSVWK